MKVLFEHYKHMFKPLDYKSWRLYLSRPFTLLGASLWHEWYVSDFCKTTFGVNLNKGLLIEYPKGVVKYYRDIEEEDRLFKCFDELAQDEAKTMRLLEQAIAFNRKAELMLQHNTLTLEEAVDFYTKLSLLSTVLPFRVGEAVLKNDASSPISELVKKLRGESYYPRILNKVIVPLIRKELERHKVTIEKAADLLTWNEIKQGKTDAVLKRITKDAAGQMFVYKNIRGFESVEWEENPSALIGKLENIDAEMSAVEGALAFKGLVKGRVRLILTNKYSEDEFNEGDILVAISTSPVLMPIIKKAGAIVTDEGGLTCHAAIIAREMRKPCIIGTKIATKVLKDGDLVEVNAGAGTVKILKHAS